LLRLDCSFTSPVNAGVAGSIDAYAALGMLSSMTKTNDPQLAAMARRGYEKWRREARTTDDAQAIKRYAREATQGDTQKFFGFTERELVATLGGE
jgi:hypothetical protein